MMTKNKPGGKIMQNKHFILMLILSLCCSLMFAATHIVCAAGTGDFTEIQAAVNAAGAGDLIVVKPGHYMPFSVGSGKNNLRIQGSGADQTFVFSRAVGNAATITSSTGVIVEGFTFSSANANGISVDADQFHARNCVFADSRDNGLYLYSEGTRYYYVTNCIFRNNSTGITRTLVCYSRNNIFINNDLSSISFDGGIVRSYNLHWNNNSNGTLGATDFIANPMFINLANNNYHLQEGSPAINTGTPGEIYFNLDGTRNSLGIYGGPYAYPNQGAKVPNFVISPNNTTNSNNISIIGTSNTR